MSSGQQLARIFQRSFTLLSQNLTNVNKGITCGCRVTSKKYQNGTFSVNRFLHTSTNLAQKNGHNFSTASDVQLQKDNEPNSKDVVISKVNDTLHREDLGRLFAVIHVQGKQRKVTTEDLVVLRGHFYPSIGDKIRLEKVLLVGGKDFTLVGRPILSRKQVKVEATVLEKTLSHFIVQFDYRPRRKRKRFNLRRENYTVLLINSIEVNPVLET
ncbi:39S ribosomal protein L21, mitochondrial-like [Mytilus californianus]|uniref:39S ribosomal protein L21, mitochondrial-like n=1 Tax=Mytilus californianus TaxID=6549 RepID=UPI002245C013|nr:39S ribosomal protein L21, mitochondrial-like [Mytilus californianus]